MDIEQHNQSTFSPISTTFASKILVDSVIVQSYFSENTSSASQIILSLTKNHIVARSTVSGQENRIFVAEIQFDLKFEIVYQEQKNVRSKKLGIKFLISSNDFNVFYTNDPSTIELWTYHLSKLINQRGFHELFKPIKKLGKGNFASVYEVERITDHEKFAVKAFSKQNTFAAKNGKQSLMNELSVMRALRHSNVLRLQSVFESDNSIYVVLEVLNGGQLFHKIQKNKGHFSKRQTQTFMHGLLSGLSHMHQNRIMHRDLKPQNIMLRNQDTMDPVIVDFGLATNADIEKYLFYRCGTPGYVAPEIVALTENVHIEPECDIFSAGVIFHILLMRKPLFEGTKYDQVYKNNKQMKFDLYQPQYEKLDSQEYELLKMMLKANPDERIKAKDALNHPYFADFNREEITKELNSPQLTVATKNTKVRKIIQF